MLCAFGSYAQAQSKIPRVGILFMGGRDQPHLEAFKKGLPKANMIDCRISPRNSCEKKSMTSGNPVEQGFAESLAKPSGNVTGLTILVSDLSGKRVELLKEAFPKSKRIATLWSPRDDLSVVGFKESENAAKAFAMQLYSMEIRKPDDIDKTFAELPKMRVDAVLVVLNPLVTLHSKHHCRACTEVSASGHVSDPSVR